VALFSYDALTSVFILLIAESGYAATDSCDEEREPAVLLGEADESIHVWLDGFHTTLHGRDGVCPAMQTHAFAPYGTKPVVSQSCSTATMCACKVTAKHEYLILLQFRNSIGCISLIPQHYNLTL